MTTIVRCALALCAGEERHDFSFAIEGDRIVRVEDFAALQARFPQAAVRAHGDGTAVIPGLVNGHSHAYQILLRGWGDDLPFERWRAEALYKVVPALSPEEIYDVFCAAFQEMLAAGITTVAEFFYLNGAGNAHAEAAIGAARDSGIRLILARAWMDAPYAPAEFRETIEEAQTRTRALMNAYPEANVCVAPHSLHAASPEMITAAAEFARAADCMMHIHVAEAEYERTQTLERFGVGPVGALERFNALNERTLAVHAIYLSEEEKAMLADRGARVVHNPMTNQYLGDGICDVVGLQRRGVSIALGTDADVKPSIFEEMRASSLLQKISARDGSALGAHSAFSMGTSAGAAALGIPAGDLVQGAYADYCVIDTSLIDPWAPLCNAIVYRGDNAWVRETYVSGKCVWHYGDARLMPARLNALMPRLRL